MVSSQWEKRWGLLIFWTVRSGCATAGEGEQKNEDHFIEQM